MREAYREQLAVLHREMTKMGGMCEQAISLALEALFLGQPELLPKVFEVDAGIDRQEREIETLCLRLLLQQQPVAADLRDISSALKMISDMERIGDQASDIAELAGTILKSGSQPLACLKDMAREAIKMVNDSVNSFLGRDLALARSVIAYDDVVDRWFDHVRETLIAQIAADNTKGAYDIDLLMIAKYLERIADHATNIAEWVEYSITGVRSKDGVVPQN
ncbi:MAG: phosphate signaling complex protein PhoU [Oscillospiraceae bacterium]|nr:phosphate signaling complex protein PhoU [Oscillospiraceae bacterium]